MNNKLILLLLFVLFLVPVSFAFEINSNEIAKTTCQGNTLLFTANIFGTGNFNLNLDGSASSWSTVVPQGFVLNNNGKTIYIYSTPNHNVVPGIYSLNLVASNQQETKTIPFKINVENCHNLQMNGENSKEICGGVITSYTYQLTNLGNYDETYNLNLKGPNFITLSQDLISLKKGESKNFFAYVNKNSESSSFTISASNQFGTAEIISGLDVNSCYDFTVSADKDFVNFCEHSEESIILTLTNTGINQDKYDITADGPQWVNIEQQSLILNPQQSGDIKLILNPDYNIKGNFDIKITIKSKDIIKTTTLKTQVNKCNDLFLDIQEKEINLCNNVQTPFLLKNTGSFEKEFRLETSEQWALLDNYQVKLKPNDEFASNIQFNVNNLEKGNYDVYIRALALDGSELSKNDVIKINVLDELQCHNTQIVSNNNIKVVQGSSTTLPITIKNNGNEKLIYEISLTGDGSSFTQLNPSIVELNPDSSETIYLYSAPSVEVNPGDYNIDVSVSYNNNLLDSKKITINVKQSEFTQKKYIPFLMRIINFFDKLFAEPLKNVTNVEQPENIEVEVEKTEAEPEIENNINVSENANETNFISNLYNQAKSYWLYIIIGIVIVIILIIIFSSEDKDKSEEDWKEEEEFEEDDEKDEKPLKIGRWILGLIIVLGLTYLQMSYNLFNNIKKYLIIGWEYASIYKFYILIALIILLIIILIIKYWGSILEFFEEDEKPKKNNRKKRKDGKNVKS